MCSFAKRAMTPTNTSDQNPDVDNFLITPIVFLLLPTITCSALSNARIWENRVGVRDTCSGFRTSAKRGRKLPRVRTTPNTPTSPGSSGNSPAKPTQGHPLSVEVKSIEDYHELRDKGGALGKINFRAYFFIDMAALGVPVADIDPT